MTPLSSDQLEFFTEQTRRAVHKAVGRYVKGAVIGFLILLMGLGLAMHQSSADNNNQRQAIVQSGRAVAVASCNGRYQDREGLRNLLISAERTIPAEVKRGNITESQAQRAKEFYDSQLGRLRLPDCRIAAHAISSDPNREIRVPVPLHPPEQTLTTVPHDSIFLG